MYSQALLPWAVVRTKSKVLNLSTCDILRAVPGVGYGSVGECLLSSTAQQGDLNISHSWFYLLSQVSEPRPSESCLELVLLRNTAPVFQEARVQDSRNAGEYVQGLWIKKTKVKNLYHCCYNYRNKVLKY